MNIEIKCPNCGHKWESGVTRYRPAKLYGPPENCHPAEGGEIEEPACPKCGTEISDKAADDLVQDAAQAERDHAADMAYERWKDRQMGL